MSRDLDSLLNAREAAAVGEWLGDDKAAFHFMRDHPGIPNHSNFPPAFFLGKKAMIGLDYCESRTGETVIN